MSCESQQSNDLLQAHEVSHVGASSQPALTCSNLTTETLEQGVKCVQS